MNLGENINCIFKRELGLKKLTHPNMHHLKNHEDTNKIDIRNTDSVLNSVKSLK